MIFPPTRAWSRRQKWLIITSSIALLVLLGRGIYSFERYRRWPGEDVFYGTWLHQPAYNGSLRYDFRPGGSLVILDSDGQPTDLKGRWYAGGPSIYLTFPPGILRDRQLVVWQIVDFSQDQFRVSPRLDEEPMVYARMKSVGRPQANR